MSQPNLSDLGVEMYYQTGSARRIEMLNAEKRSRRAAWPLRVNAVLYSFWFIMALGVLQPYLTKGIGVAWLIVAICGGFAAAFWILWLWSRVNPLPAAILGLLLYTSLRYAVAARYANGPLSQIAGTMAMSTMVGIGFLTWAIITASRERRLALAQANPPGSPQANPGGIASGIWLYLVLLTIVVIPISLGSENNYAFHDFLDVLKLEAIIVLTWAGIAWRDTLPALRNFASANWYVMAVMLGFATALFGSLYSDLLAAFLGQKSQDLANPYATHGIGWLGTIGLIALYPAIFEELAFRGVILPCLQRLLTSKEAIIVSGTMFMILHLRPVEAPVLLIAGLLLGYVRVKSKSLYPGMLIHFTHNAMIVAFAHWNF